VGYYYSGSYNIFFVHGFNYMRSKKEIREALQQCESYSIEYNKRVRGFPYDESILCPIDDGCCYECGWGSGLEWCLGGKKKGNLQTQIIDGLKG